MGTISNRKAALISSRNIYSTIKQTISQLKWDLIELEDDMQDIAAAIINLKNGHEPSEKELDALSDYIEKYNL
jgi:septal ring factor EnvC (AmiA/AmiB activator)